MITVADGATAELLTGPGDLSLGGFSPDGRYLVYAIDAQPAERSSGASTPEAGGVFLFSIVDVRPQGLDSLRVVMDQ